MEPGWFSPNVRYDGSGKAEFSSPPGTATGNVVALLNEDGTSDIAMGQPTIEADTDSVRNNVEFLQGTRIVTNEAGQRSVKLSRRGANICTGLTVTLRDGMLTAEDSIPLSYTIPTIGGGPYRVGFDPGSGLLR